MTATRNEALELEVAPAAETRLGVAVVGCGLVGKRRAEAAATHAQSRLISAIDIDAAAAEAIAAEHGGEASVDWRDAAGRDDVGVVVVATPNAYLTEIGVAALEAGKHVLVEKPAGRTIDETRRLAAAARASGCVCKVGFNHRHHAGIRRAHDYVEAGAIGRVLNLRARYGHGARAGCEREWRADARLSGGGELLDQGIHIVDLLRWFAGEPTWVVATLQTAHWDIAPLEDNAFGLLRFGDVVAQLHVSMTQWKNLFSLEIFGERGSVSVEGLGGNYGVQRLILMRRRAEGGAPTIAEEVFPEDVSWAAEWDAFVTAVRTGARVEGDAEEGVAAMQVVEAMYRSARSGVGVRP